MSDQQLPTDEELAHWRKLANKATPGPWGACGDDRGGCVCCMVWARGPDVPILDNYRSDDLPHVPVEEEMANALFAAASREAVPRLLSAYYAMRKRAERAEKTLRAMLESGLEGNQHAVGGCEYVAFGTIFAHVEEMRGRWKVPSELKSVQEVMNYIAARAELAERAYAALTTCYRCECQLVLGERAACCEDGCVTDDDVDAAEERQEAQNAAISAWSEEMGKR